MYSGLKANTPKEKKSKKSRWRIKKGRESRRAGDPERPKPQDLVGAGAGAILFFLQKPEWEPEHFKKLEGSRSWSRSWHTLVRLQSPTVFKNFVKK